MSVLRTRNEKWDWNIQLAWKCCFPDAVTYHDIITSGLQAYICTLHFHTAEGEMRIIKTLEQPDNARMHEWFQHLFSERYCMLLFFCFLFKLKLLLLQWDYADTETFQVNILKKQCWECLPTNYVFNGVTVIWYN